MDTSQAPILWSIKLLSKEMFEASQVQELLYNPDEESIPYILFVAVLILNATAVVSVEIFTKIFTIS